MIKVYTVIIGTFLLFGGLVYSNFDGSRAIQLSDVISTDREGGCIETVDITLGDPLDCPEDTTAQLVATVSRSPECFSTFLYFFNWKKDGVDVRNFLADFGVLTDELSDLEPGNDPLSPGVYLVTVSDVESGAPSFNDMFTLEVEDNTPPVIDCPSNSIVATDSGLCTAVVSFPVPSATDDCLFTITQTAGLPSGSAFPLGDTTITYTATDGAGNSSNCSFTITVEDQEPPELTCINEKMVEVSSDEFYIVPDYIAEEIIYDVSDNCTDPVTIGSQDPPPGTQLGEGAYNVTLTFEDEAGNTADCEFTLIVSIILGADEENFDTSISVINPVINYLKVSNTGKIPLNRFAIFDRSGKTVMGGAVNTSEQVFRQDVSTLSEGIYFLQLESGPYRSIRRIVKK